MHAGCTGQDMMETGGNLYLAVDVSSCLMMMLIIDLIALTGIKVVSVYC